MLMMIISLAKQSAVVVIPHVRTPAAVYFHPTWVSGACWLAYFVVFRPLYFVHQHLHAFPPSKSCYISQPHFLASICAYFLRDGQDIVRSGSSNAAPFLLSSCSNSILPPRSGPSRVYGWGCSGFESKQANFSAYPTPL